MMLDKNSDKRLTKESTQQIHSTQQTRTAPQAQSTQQMHYVLPPLPALPDDTPRPVLEPLPTIENTATPTRFAGTATTTETSTQSPQALPTPAATAHTPQTTHNAQTTHTAQITHTATHRTPIVPVFVGIIIIIGLIGLFSWSPTDVTGFIAFNTQINATSAASATIPLPQLATGVSATGSLYGEGEGEIWLITTTGERRLVLNVTSDPGTPRTNKASYSAGEAVIIEHLPSDASIYLDDGREITPIEIPFNAPATDASILVVENTTGQATTYRLPLIIGNVERATHFEKLCIQTCSMNETNGSLLFETTGSATLSIEQVQLNTITANTPPTITSEFTPILINQTMTIDLSPHFADADGDTLMYSVDSTADASVSVFGSLLTITPLRDGTSSLTVYASDLKDMIFTTIPLNINMLPSTANTSNDTSNVTADNTALNGTNVTTTNTTETVQNATNQTETPIVETIVNTTQNTTIDANETIALNTTTVTTVTPTSSDCNDPNPNLRPSSCFAGNEEAVFEELVAPMQDKQLRLVGRMTRYGNLVIRGVLRESSTSMPDSNAFSVGYTTTQNFRDTTISTAWIDSTTGDLHLRGLAHQEQATVVPPQYGSYIIQNSNGLVLAYIDRQTGDLYLRGDVVQLGKLQ